MSDFSQYMLAQANTRAEFNRYCDAGHALELAKIRERLAKLESQYAPLCNLKSVNRPEAYAVAFYAVIGRWPDGFSYMDKHP